MDDLQSQVEKLVEQDGFGLVVVALMHVAEDKSRRADDARPTKLGEAWQGVADALLQVGFAVRVVADAEDDGTAEIPDVMKP